MLISEINLNKLRTFEEDTMKVVLSAKLYPLSNS